MRNLQETMRGTHQINPAYRAGLYGIKLGDELPTEVLLGAYRPIEQGENVPHHYIHSQDGEEMVPARIYGPGSGSLKPVDSPQRNGAPETSTSNQTVIFDRLKTTPTNPTSQTGEPPTIWSNPKNQLGSTTRSVVGRKGLGRYSGNKF